MIGRIADDMGALLLGREAWRARQYRRAKRIAQRSGHEIYLGHLIWQHDPDYLRVCETVRRLDLIGIPNDRCYVLLELARKLRGIPGDIADCGLRFGKSSLFLLAGSGAESGKTLHGFDSFEGLSTPGANDLDDEGSFWSPGDLAVSEDAVRANLAEHRDRVVLHKGWIPERFAEVDGNRFALAHIDVDLYEPTLAAVRFFYDRMSPGGAIVCDDYGSSKCPGARKAIDETFRDKPEPVFALPTGQSLVFKK